MNRVPSVSNNQSRPLISTSSNAGALVSGGQPNNGCSRSITHREIKVESPSFFGQVLDGFGELITLVVGYKELKKNLSSCEALQKEILIIEKCDERREYTEVEGACERMLGICSSVSDDKARTFLYGRCYGMLGSTYIMQKKWMEAKKTLKCLVELVGIDDKQKAQGYFLLGSCYFKLKQYIEAQDAYDSALQVPGCGDQDLKSMVYQSQYELYKVQEKYMLAEVAIKSRLSRCVNYNEKAEFLPILTNLCMLQKKYAEAQDLCKEILRLPSLSDNQKTEARYHLGLMYLVQDKYWKAYIAFQRGLKDVPASEAELRKNLEEATVKTFIQFGWKRGIYIVLLSMTYYIFFA